MSPFARCRVSLTRKTVQHTLSNHGVTMDQELVQYLDSRFQSVNRQFQELRGEMSEQLQGLRGGTTAGLQGLRGEMTVALHGLRGEMSEGFQGLRGETTEELQDLRGEMTAGLEEVKRHSGVLVEGLRHELQLVAEGLAMHIQVQHVQEREYHDRQHQETRVLLRSFYDEFRQQNAQFQQSQDHLRQRVENL